MVRVVPTEERATAAVSRIRQPGGASRGKVIAGITTSVDGVHHGPGRWAWLRSRQGGERLHYWVFGGPWSYHAEPTGEMSGEDKAWMDEAMSGLGAVVAGRWTYEAADHQRPGEPVPPFFIVTHRTSEQPAGDAFAFVGSLEGAIEQAQGRGGR